jgi:acetoin utilization protein AcuB
MQLRSIMKKHVATIRPADNLSLAVQNMLWAGVRHLPVVESGELVGILSERDILSYSGRHGGTAKNALTSDAMSSPARFASPDDTIAVVSKRMADERLGCMPIVEHGNLVGIITTVDLLANEGKEEFEADIPPAVAASDVMTKEVTTVREDHTLGSALTKFAEQQIRHLPVIDGMNRVVGLLHDRDIRPAPGSDWSQTRVASVMEEDPTKVRPDAALEKLTKIFVDSRVTAVLVTDERERLLGIVSYVDVLKRLSDS